MSPALPPPQRAALARSDVLLLGALAVLALGLAVARPLSWRGYLAQVDWRTLAALCGLLVITRGVQLSGLLQALARRTLRRLRDQRALAFALLALAALLASVLTNDVSLFLLVPLTAELAVRACLPLARLVVFEALAVNAGSALTPIGNPQNLFLWRHSGLGFGGWMAMMAPAVVVMLALLALATWLAFPRRPLQFAPPPRPLPQQPRLLLSCVALPLFVLAIELDWTLPALLAVLALFLLAAPAVLARFDWPLLAIIGLMFFDMNALAGLPPVGRWLAGLPIDAGAGAYLAGIVASQFISNVPATILLHGEVSSLQTLAVAVNVGGFGLLVGSLANLIALRLGGVPGTWRLFHAVSLPFLLVCAGAVWLVLR